MTAADRRIGGSAESGRREFVGILVAGLLSAYPAIRLSAQSQDSVLPSGRLFDPTRAGRPMEPRGAADNRAAVKAVEDRLHCTCGCNLSVYTCRTTDFTCTTSPAMHRQVMALMDQGKTADEILAAFVAEHGEQILMAPPKQGFNLAGYFVPSLVIGVAAGLLVLAMRRWTRQSARLGARAAAEGPPDVSPEALDELNRELDRLDS